jgi:hypothetical protein
MAKHRKKQKLNLPASSGAKLADQMPFAGPLFIVGMSRSGTKLLLHLLRQNPLLALPRAEAYFISRFSYEATDSEWRPDSRWKERFFGQFRRSGFCINSKRLYGIERENSDIGSAVNQARFQDIVRSLVMLFSEADPAVAVMWGAKTPIALYDMPVLKRIFPEARFLHIVRDPRDRALSVRNAWGGNIYLVSENWRRGVAQAEALGKRLGHDYLRVRYEDLLLETHAVVDRICGFLEIPFSDSMLRLSRPVENLGDSSHPTRTEARIYRENIGKATRRFTSEELRRIESLVFPFAREAGHETRTSDIHFRPLSRLERITYASVDNLVGYVTPIRRFGVTDGHRIVVERFMTRWQRKRHAVKLPASPSLA